MYKGSFFIPSFKPIEILSMNVYVVSTVLKF